MHSLSFSSPIRYVSSMTLLRLSGRKRCDFVRRKGKKWNGKHLAVRWLEGPPRHPDIDPHTPGFYTGLVTSTQLDKSAVKRNRMRRRCREALRTILKEYPKNLPTIQLLVFPRSSSMQCTFAELQNDVSAFLSTL